MIDRWNDLLFNRMELKSVLKTALLCWLFLLCILLFIWLTRLGLQQDVVGLSWGPPGTPITFLQVILVTGISLALALGGAWFCLRSHHTVRFLLSIRDTLIFIALWSLAVILWSHQPMYPTHFSPPPMPPNYEAYPNSDAMVFDRSSYHLLYGIGFADRLVRRPLYVGVLALFHGLVGGNYDATVFLQITLLALIPGFIYLFTSRISNRVAGLIAGGLIVVREKNSIALSGKIVTSHAKLMMSDMITTLGLVIVLYLTVRWLFREKPHALEFSIVGACLGLTALIRTQVLILILPLLFFIYIIRKSLIQAVKSSTWILFGIILVMAPWVWRNWTLTGTFVLDDRGEEKLLARNYSLSPTFMPSPQSGETDEEFSARIKANIIGFIFTHPGDIAYFVSNHFMRNLVTGSIYIAPNYTNDSPEAVIQHLPFWDYDWSGTLTRNSRVALFLNLGILALGGAVMFEKNRWIGLFPLTVFFVYSFGNALVRSSGWRFNQPVDWIILLYYSVAIAYPPVKLWKQLVGYMPDKISDQNKNEFGIVVTQSLVLLALFLIGASVPLAERLIPASDFNGSLTRVKDILINEKIFSPNEINAFLSQKDAILISGVALYPRYVRPNSRFTPIGEPKDYTFLHFWLINGEDYEVILPLQNVPELDHNVTVSVIGCREGNYVSAIAIIVHGLSDRILFRSPSVSLICPLTEPQ